MKIIKIICFLLASYHLCAQDYFIKKVSFDDRTNSGVQILEHQERIFVLAGHFCDNLECSSIAELSANGDTLWVTRVQDIDVALSSMIIYGDTITVTGSAAPLYTKFRMAHFDLDGEKLGETIEIEHPVEKFTYKFQLTSVRFQNKTLVTGTGMQNSIEYGLIYVMNADDELDTLIMLEPQDKESTMWEIAVGKNGFLYTYHEIDEGVLNKERKIINKFDKDFNHVWRYQSEDTYKWDGGSYGEVLEDGRVLLVTYSPISNSPHSSIRAINQDGSIDWQYNVPYIPFGDDGKEEIIGRVTQLPSGNILCMGLYTDITLDAPIRNSPYLYKMNTEGEIIWKRVFYDLDPVTGVSRVGLVKDAIELENGDIYGTGWMDYDGQREVFIFKVDTDGCLDAEDCEFVQVITDAEDIEIRNDIKIYPNPVSDILTIAADAVPEKVEIYTVDGVLVEIEYRTTEVDVSRLASGIYYLKVFVNGRVSVVSFVK
jgi:hypothetical protein